jgi:hypothetical protein
MTFLLLLWRCDYPRCTRDQRRRLRDEFGPVSLWDLAPESVSQLAIL